MQTALPTHIGKVPVHPIDATKVAVPGAWRAWHRVPELFTVKTPIGWADARFGDPTWDDPTGDGQGPETGWCLAFPCGLKCAFVVLRAPQTQDGFELLQVFPETAETEHLLRHLGAPREWVEGDVLREPDEATNPPRGQKETWAIWRQDDNGHQLVAGYGATERDARCLADAFERRAHKQMYWVERRAGDAGTAPVRRRE